MRIVSSDAGWRMDVSYRKQDPDPDDSADSEPSSDALNTEAACLCDPPAGISPRVKKGMACGLIIITIFTIFTIITIITLCITGLRGASTPTPAASTPTPSHDPFENCKKFTNVSSERLYHDAAVKSCEDQEAALLRESDIEDVKACGMMPEEDVWIDRDNPGGSDKPCEVYNGGSWTNLACTTPRRFICKKSRSA